MKKFSHKRTALERKYVEAKRKKAEDWNNCCEGCGIAKPCTCSHTIPRSYDISLLADIDNLQFLCHTCHAKCEAGKYDQLLCGQQMIDYIERTRPEYLLIKQLKQ